VTVTAMGKQPASALFLAMRYVWFGTQGVVFGRLGRVVDVVSTLSASIQCSRSSRTNISFFIHFSRLK
jgi:hypothetical protein